MTPGIFKISPQVHFSLSRESIPTNFSGPIRNAPQQPVHGTTPTNVLVRHWEKNRAPRPPNPELLARTASLSSGRGGTPLRPTSSRGSHTSGLARGSGAAPGPSSACGPPGRSSVHGSGSPPNSVAKSQSGEGSDHSSDAEPTRTRARRNTYRKETAPPHQLRYYTTDYPIWGAALARAKFSYQDFILSGSGFPEDSGAKFEAKECIGEATDGQIEQGMAQESELAVDKNMTKLVTDVGAHFRGEIKRFGRTIVAMHYSLFPANGATHPKTNRAYTPSERIEFCAEEVRKLLKDGRWLHSGKERGENLNHPILEAFIQKFIYSGSPSIASEFPKTYEKSVPIAAVALFGAVTKNCLDEMATGVFRQLPFSAENYKRTYNTILAFIKQYLESKDGHLYEKQLQDWAQGRKTSKNTSEPRLILKLNS
ncbi:hypothetical protein B0H12DRAFT_1103653 [Mycena haematopus]|nr:hypothetical protein B0H12DRAFT_1103653 [Mycena haematopus]